MHLRNKDQTGYTLVELITAMVIGTIMIGSAILILTNGQGLGQRHRDLVVVNAFAEKKVEALRSAGFLSLNNGTTNITSEMPSELQSPRSASLVTSTFSTGVKKIQVDLTYNDQGAARSYTYTTMIGELGVGQY